MSSSCKKSHCSSTSAQSTFEYELKQCQNSSHNRRVDDGQRSLDKMQQSTALPTMASRRITQSHEDLRNGTSSSTAPIPILPCQSSLDENQMTLEMTYYNEKSWEMFHRIRRHRASIQYETPMFSALKTEDMNINEIYQDRLGRTDSCGSLDCSIFPFSMD